ncbi:TPA: hypothetical protein IUY07_000487 [Enterococcus faecalis OG1RF]|nr:hypothetical protein [Enterococcus faecalis OG1RF]
MVPKPSSGKFLMSACFRVMLFRMVPKRRKLLEKYPTSFRVMLFRMVPKR